MYVLRISRCGILVHESVVDSIQTFNICILFHVSIIRYGHRNSFMWGIRHNCVVIFVWMFINYLKSMTIVKYNSPLCMHIEGIYNFNDFVAHGCFSTFSMVDLTVSFGAEEFIYSLLFCGGNKGNLLSWYGGNIIQTLCVIVWYSLTQC